MNSFSYSFFLILREDSKVSHYIINVSDENSKSIYKIGDKTFSTMKELLTFYKQRLLDTSPLVRIVCFDIRLNELLFQCLI
jgi:proto-oncogene C-crk